MTDSIMCVALAYLLPLASRKRIVSTAGCPATAAVTPEPYTIHDCALATPGLISSVNGPPWMCRSGHSAVSTETNDVLGRVKPDEGASTCIAAAIQCHIAREQHDRYHSPN